MQLHMVAVGFALVVCAAFVVLTRAAALLPSHEMDALAVGLAFFVVPCVAVFPLGAPLWAACLYGGWSLSDTALARRRRMSAATVPDRLPDDWGPR
jgi:hypothetical protein